MSADSTASTLAQYGRLDPRAAAQAAARPIVAAVNIPFDEIPERTHELPPKAELIDVVGPAELTTNVVEWLRCHGRRGRAAGEIEYAAVDAVSQPGRLWRPNAWLERILPRLTAGRALDLACGMGREAVHMATMGWRVTAIDILPDALDRARSLQQHYGRNSPAIEWIRGDLEQDDPPIAATFDLIVGFRYLHRPLLVRLSQWLRPGGHVIYETFTTHHRERNARPSRDAFLLQPGELPTLLAMLTVREHAESWQGGAHTARIWAMLDD